RFEGRQIPPELILLAEQQRKLTAVAIIALPRHVAEHAGRAPRWIEQTGQHFQRGGFSRAVGAEKADQLALGDAEADFLHGNRQLVFSVEEASNRADKARLLFVSAEGFGQAIDIDNRHCASVAGAPRDGNCGTNRTIGPQDHRAKVSPNYMTAYSRGRTKPEKARRS